MRLVVEATVLLLAQLAVAAPPDCADGVFLPHGSPKIRGLPITAIEITRNGAPRLRVYGPPGNLACEGELSSDRRMRARLDRCLADASSTPTCWCSPAVIRLKAAPDCATLRGSARWAGRRRRLSGTRGFCGDGFLDWRHEECDGRAGLGCSPLEECSDCRCTPTRR